MIPTINVANAAIATTARITFQRDGRALGPAHRRCGADRLVDLALITVLRDFMSRAQTPPAWYRASGDPVVGRALLLLHNNSSHAWTISRLAQAVGVSRATLARRFTALVGEPPMAYLTAWRLAADLLADRRHSLSTIASRVGYGSSLALSAAFKREFGMSPTSYAASTPKTPSGGGDAAMID